jgi:DNA-binding MurR/RpiR family transcriptional regulator
MITIPEEAQYISVQAAAKELHVSDMTIIRYMQRMHIMIERFQYDKNRYLKMQEFLRIKTSLDERAKRVKTGL